MSKVRTLLSSIIVLLLLSGCTKINIDYRFNEGMVDGGIVLSLSPEATQEDISNLPREELTRLCSETSEYHSINAGVELKDLTGTVNSDGWLECKSVFDRVPVSDLSVNGFEVHYNAENRSYQVTVKASPDSETKMLENLGVDVSMGLAFDHLEKITVNGVPVEDAGEGVTVSGGTILIDGLNLSGDVLIEASDGKENPLMSPMLASIVGVIIVASFVSIVIFLVKTRSRKQF